MPKDQKLSVEEKIFKQLSAPAPQLRAAEKRAAMQIAARKYIKDLEDFTSGRRNPIVEIFENMPGKYEDGGEAVPKKFKGFSKLPEAVQERMDPDLASKYVDGGEVSGSGKKARGRGKGNCRGMGAAMRGGRFTGCK